MSELAKYIMDNCIRGTCTCEKCVDALSGKFQLDGHTADVQFFKVTLKNNPKDNEKEIIKNKLTELIKRHNGEFCDLDLFNGDEYNCLQIGDWMGDLGLALTLMGMGEILRMWQLTTPNKVAPDFSDETRRMLAEAGYISIMSKMSEK